VRNNPGNIKVREEEGGRRCSRHWNRDFPAAHREGHGEGGVSLKPTERTTLEQIPTAQSMEEPTPEQGTYFLKELPPAESPHWSRFSLCELSPTEDPCLSRLN